MTPSIRTYPLLVCAATIVALLGMTTLPALSAPITRDRPTATQNNSNPSNVIDGSADQWYSVGTGANTDYFATAPDPVIVIDLGGQQTIDEFDFRNYSITGNRLKSFDLAFATESEGPGAFGSSIAGQPGVTVANQDQNQVQTIGLAQSVSARYVQMTLTDNYAEAGPGGDRVGFAEIQFGGGPKLADTLTPFRAVAATSSTDATDYWKVVRLLDSNPNTSWVTRAPGSDYFATGPIPVLTFDLGKDTDLAGVLFRNYGSENGTKDFELTFATEADGANGFGTSIDLTAVLHPLFHSDQELLLPEPVRARYVQMRVLDNYEGWKPPGGDRVGFNDIQFLAVPEPATMALAGLGLAALGGYLRRRRNA